MDTSPRESLLPTRLRARGRDVAALIVLGTGLALLGMALVRIAAPENALGVWAGGLMTLAGYAVVLAGLVRWVLRTRRVTQTATVQRTAAHAGV